MVSRKGIILAGGSGTRLFPITLQVSKQLLPVFNKPMIYYPISTLMMAGIRDIAVITSPRDKEQFFQLIGNGSQWGVEFKFITQESPDGLAQAYLLTESFLDGCPSAMILGDNIFFGENIQFLLKNANDEISKATVFGYHVSDPGRYGVIGFDKQKRVVSLVEKPLKPASSCALCGLYFLDERASNFAGGIVPSSRGELEITDLLKFYLKERTLILEILDRGCAWLDAGTPDSLLDAGNFVKTIEERQGLLVGSPDEIAFRKGWISAKKLSKRAELFEKTSYGKFLKKLL